MSGPNPPPIRRSRRLATVIPARQWEGMGYDPTTAQSLEFLQLDLEKFGSDRDAGEIKLRGRDNEEGRLLRGGVPHHELLLPHWQKFARGLEGRQNLQKIWIAGVHLPPPVLEVVIPALNRLRFLSLVCVSLGTTGFLRLSSLLKENTSLAELMLGGAAIEGMDVADSLSDAIASHASLEHLYILCCGLKNAAILGRVLDGCKRLRAIALDGNMIGSPQGVAVLADFISANHRVELLRLRENAITEGDAAILATTLKTNDRLRCLDLSKNNIAGAGRSALLRAVFDTTTMSSIIASNHTCQVLTCHDYSDRRSMGSSMGKTLERHLGRINSKDVSEGKKIYLKAVLSLRLGGSYGPGGCDGKEKVEPFDLKHFADVPLKLGPRLLELIQEHPEMNSDWEDDAKNQKKMGIHALSALFHTLRCWQMPSLFTNLHIPSEGAGRKRKRNARR